MKLIVGLGNPGKKYKDTKHNMGFMCLDNYISKSALSYQKSSKFNGEYIKDGDTIFLKPLTYMNKSGISVRKMMDYFDIDADDILIIYDDLDLPLGKLRLRSKGRAGGHNGVKSIIEYINTSEFKRLRIGIGNDDEMETSNYVLSNITKSEFDELLPAIKTSKDIIDDFHHNIAFNTMMTKYN
ncbi:MAG: aminoacyl-tRNA hydrolase [Candidatus Izimaplasma sp.]|nr:aminoacyl-tRNA hydrolase [Candidatus Izimaplasma bacterium]